MSNKMDTGHHPYLGDRLSRKEFIDRAGLFMAMGLGGLTPGSSVFSGDKTHSSRIRIRNVNSDFEREPLIPYHFKGGAITECWQTAAYLESESGVRKIGLGTQNVLWSDSNVFSGNSNAAGNALMFAMSARALQLMKGNPFSDPLSLLDDLLPEVHAYGRKITNRPDLRNTFALNALVCVDNAAWLLYAAENKMKTFDEMIPRAYRPALSYRHSKVASIPSFSVGTDVAAISKAARDGYFIMKLKIGSSGSQKEMLEKDMAFLSAVHSAIGHLQTPHTSNGRIPYYLDPNARYQSKDSLLRLLDHARKIGAFDQIAIIEEPFAEDNEARVDDMGVIVAADESAHSVESAAIRIEQGYQAIVLKAIAKTLSMTLKIAQFASRRQVPCFCADLTVNPILVDWNKCVAARLSPLPNVNIGLMEANGHQYYKDWSRLKSYHPCNGAEWLETRDGVYNTGKAFFDESAGIFNPSEHYVGLFK